MVVGEFASSKKRRRVEPTKKEAEAITREKKKARCSVYAVVKKKASFTSKYSCEEENMCPNSTITSTPNHAPKHLLDTILAAQSSMFASYNVDLQRKRKKEAAQGSMFAPNNVSLQRKREAARVMTHNMQRTVFIDDNLGSFQELERLCGCALTPRSSFRNPLERVLGLVLKDEFETPDFDEEKFLSRDWEEACSGYIILTDGLMLRAIGQMAFEVAHYRIAVVNC